MTSPDCDPYSFRKCGLSTATTSLAKQAGGKTLNAHGSRFEVDKSVGCMVHASGLRYIPCSDARHSIYNCRSMQERKQKCCSAVAITSLAAS